ncbi:sulfotransferase [Tropicimonas sediminicola]|uniref:Sulfotransferase family protein n=1 Tax=Tropicimonas sediminicola TaxID=1031541 RepID=A0A239HLD1_9RHOB|nr:sulfotransferase [Tropicimonas sediminicola]SNS81898.1 Sulfotransferase family protein [Tropicimonas sediminicola]
MATNDPVFILGVGAQKSGTTWLYSYLRKHPDCAMSAEKELGFFNVHFTEADFPKAREVRLQRLVNSATRQIRNIQQGKPKAESKALVALMDSIAMQFEPRRYMRHFKQMRADHPNARLFGDITPEYAGLSADNFRTIREWITGAGFRPRVVYLMRDPVERCYSALRMADRNRKDDGGAIHRPARERLATEAVSHWCEVRTRYERTIPALEAAFGPDELYLGIYEDFFRTEVTQELCGFLDIPYVAPNFEHMANSSPRDSEPAAEDVATVRAFYSDTYDFCRERFGAERIDRLWTAA